MPENIEHPLNVRFRYEQYPLLWELDDVYAKSECDALIKLIESRQPAMATNNAMYRDQDRVMIDDPIAAEALFSRIKPSLPPAIEAFKLSHLNERFRFYRYAAGQKFSPHMDHWYQSSDNEISLFSVLVYLNEDFTGGETKFMEQLNATVTPSPGKVAIFQHKVRHEGCEVLSGIKYAARTDVMYKKQACSANAQRLKT